MCVSCFRVDICGGLVDGSLVDVIFPGFVPPVLGLHLTTLYTGSLTPLLPLTHTFSLLPLLIHSLLPYTTPYSLPFSFPLIYTFLPIYHSPLFMLFLPLPPTQKSIPLVSQPTRKVLGTREGAVAASLVHDFLQCLGLDFSLSVFVPESGHPALWSSHSPEALSSSLGLSSASAVKGERDGDEKGLCSCVCVCVGGKV